MSEGCPELLLNKRPKPTARELAERLAGFWLAAETVLHRTLEAPAVTRVGGFYRHRLGASPQQGGWPVKTPTVLDRLFVHWAAAGDYVDAEEAMVWAFAAAVSPESVAALYHPDPLMPFANLEDATNADRRRKPHGIGRITGLTPPQRAAPARGPR